MKNGLILAALLMFGCKASHQVVAFDSQEKPAPPDYAQSASWAVLPQAYPPQLKPFLTDSLARPVDVFYVYPTLLTDRKNSQWNASVEGAEVRQEVLNTPVQFQASAWAAAGNLYVPFYRQAHYRAYLDPYKEEGEKAFLVAYSDVRNAFGYYLKHYNQGKPIILAGHSQGSHHLKEIVREFFDNKPLQKQLVAAYLIGIKLKPDEFKTLQPLYDPTQVGGYITWNTYKKGHLPKTYANWYQGGITVNPITWNNADMGAETQHLGVLNSDLKIYPNSVAVQRVDGMLWATVPKIPKRFWLSFIKNYHFADINLFWADIQQNAQQRASHWLTKNAPNP